MPTFVGIDVGLLMLLIAKIKRCNIVHALCKVSEASETFSKYKSVFFGGGVGTALKLAYVCRSMPVKSNCVESVSYTHLTLPTNREV